MRKWKIGLLGAVVMSGVMLAPVFMTGATSGAVSDRTPAVRDPIVEADPDYIAFQVGNSYGVKEHARYALGGSVKPFVDESSRVQVPLRAAGEGIGLTVTFDEGTQLATLTDGKLTATLTVGIPQMTVGEEIIDLPTAPVVQDGSTYIPARALENIGGWSLEYLPDDKGGYIIFKTSPDADVTAEVSNLLGASTTQYLAGGLLVRSGSDKALAHGTEVSFSGMATFDDDTSLYFPLVESVEAMGGTVAVTGGKAEVQLGDRTASLDIEKNTATVDRSPEAGENFALHELESVIYVSDDLLAALLGMHKTVLGDGVIAFTVAALDGYPDQEEALRARGAALAEQKPKVSVPEAEHYVALTFDDGPTGQSEGLTARLLTALNERGAHATFFMCGYRVKDFHAVLDRYLEEGHEMGNHTMDHKSLTKLSVSGIHEQVDGNSELIESYAGEQPTVMRPTGGAYNDTVKAEMEKSGLPIILWSLDTLDWQSRDASSVERKILNNVQDGDIILMHDLYESTYTGVLNAVDKLKEQGYAFVTVSELAAIKGVTLEPGKVYTSFR